jgi:hypothetical protein
MNGTGIGLDEQFDFDMAFGDVRTNTGIERVETDLGVILASVLDEATAGETITERDQEILRAGVREALQAHQEVQSVPTITFNGNLVNDTIEATVEVRVTDGLLTLTETN